MLLCFNRDEDDNRFLAHTIVTYTAKDKDDALCKLILDSVFDCHDKPDEFEDVRQTLFKIGIQEYDGRFDL